MKKFLAGLAVVLMGYGLPGMASALPISVENGGFESGSLLGWTSTSSGGGSTSVVTTDGGFSPTAGYYFANLTADSAISQSVSWSAGDTLSFDWNFNANDVLPYNDFSIFKISSAAGTSLYELLLSNVFTTGDGNASGWNSYAYTFASSGTGSIAFGVFNFGDTYFSSQLYIDNINSAPVPEPATMLLFGSGLAGLAGMARRRMRMAA